MISQANLFSLLPMVVSAANQNWRGELRTLLILGRVSNLPTVWSNCLAGWLLSGGGGLGRFALLCAGTSCLYVGGMFLNDAFDAEFDRQFRQERPIPSGKTTVGKVWGWGLGWLLAGLLFLSLLGTMTSVLAILLAGCILLYDAVHKAITLSPLLMAACRFLLYLLASSAAPKGLAGLAVWSGLALGLYTLGLSSIARTESFRNPARLWPCFLLAAPILLAWIVNSEGYKGRAILLSLTLALWIVYSLSHSYSGNTTNIGRTVSGLLAGICLVDLLTVAGGPGAALVFLLFFASALLGQRFIPAT